MRQRLWNDAIVEIQRAQALLDPKSTAGIDVQLTRMLAECYRQTGVDESRLAELQNVASKSGAAVSDASRLELAQALMKSGGQAELNQALEILQSLAEKRPELELDIARLLTRQNDATAAGPARLEGRG